MATVAKEKTASMWTTFTSSNVVQSASGTGRQKLMSLKALSTCWLTLLWLRCQVASVTVIISL